MVEMALLLPFLLFVVFGIIDMGWYIYGYSTIYQAARNGAEKAAELPPLDQRCLAQRCSRNDDMRENDHERDAVDGAPIFFPDLTTGTNAQQYYHDQLPRTGRRALGQPVQIDISYKLQPLTPLWRFVTFGTQGTMTVTTTARRSIESLGDNPTLSIMSPELHRLPAARMTMRTDTTFENRPGAGRVRACGHTDLLPAGRRRRSGLDLLLDPGPAQRRPGRRHLWQPLADRRQPTGARSQRHSRPRPPRVRRRGGIGFVNLLDLNNDGIRDVGPDDNAVVGANGTTYQTMPDGTRVIDNFIQIQLLNDTDTNGDPMNDLVGGQPTPCVNPAAPASAMLHPRHCPAEL